MFNNFSFTDFVLCLCAFYVLLLVVLMAIHLRQNRIMGIDSKGELTYLNKKEIRYYKRKYKRIFSDGSLK